METLDRPLSGLTSDPDHREFRSTAGPRVCNRKIRRMGVVVVVAIGDKSISNAKTRAHRLHGGRRHLALFNSQQTVLLRLLLQLSQ